MSEVLLAKARAFHGPSLFSAAQVEAALDTTAPAIPTSGSTAPFTWKQVHMEGDASLSYSRPVVKLRTHTEKGVQKILGDRDDGAQLTLPIADISIANLVNVIQESLGASVSDVSRKVESWEGVDLSSYARPIIVYHMEYDSDNEGDDPKIGTGADPNAILIFGAIPPLELEYFGADQEIWEMTFELITQNGTTEKNVYFTRIDLSNTIAEV